MKLVVRSLLLAAGSFVAAGLTADVNASGIILYEWGPPDVGLASAGYTARANDASTFFKNPAGMSRLNDSDLLGGAELLFGRIKFTPHNQTSARLGNNDGGNAMPVLPEMSGFFTRKVTDRLTVGLGMLSYFGLAEKYDENWVGRYYVQNGALLGMSLVPSVSYELTDWLSIGAGANAMYGYMENAVAINNLALRDGQMKIQDEDWGFGATAGALIKLSDRTRVGVSYLSRVNLDFKDTPEFIALGPVMGAALNRAGLLTGQLNIGVTVPQQVMAGVYHDLNDKWSVMVDGGWQNWKQFGMPTIAVVSTTPKSLTLNQDYQNTWHLAGGAEFRPNTQWAFTSGIAYDSSPVTDANRGVILPVGANWRFGLGARWQVSRCVNIGGAAELIWNGDLNVDQNRGPLAGRVSGTYENSYVAVLALNLKWDF